jgi:hypothetical protein
MGIEVKQSASDLDDIVRNAMGGELGTTLFCAGVRAWIPEAATAADIQHAAEALQLIADMRQQA